MAPARRAGLVWEHDYLGDSRLVDASVQRLRAKVDPAPPSDPGELAALLDVEERLGATDPYRQLGQLAHLILRRPPAP